MAHSDFMTVYQRFQTQYKQAVNAKQTHGLNEHQYIQLAIAAEALNYQEDNHAKVEELAREYRQLVANQRKGNEDSEKRQLQYVKRFEELIKTGR